MPYKTYLTNRTNSEKYRLNGIIRSTRSPNKPNLCQAFRNHKDHRPKKLPPKVDLRPQMTAVEEQGKIGTCIANSLAGAYEYLLKKATGQNIDVSRLFIYYNARAKDQTSTRVDDIGCTMTSGIEALEEFGTCLESHWPYYINRVNTRPSKSAYQEAKHHKITKALEIDVNLSEMKSCLAQGFPFAFGLQLFTSFDKAAKTGIVPMPNKRDLARTSHGCHAMLAVGYSDRSNSFIVRNSWGEQWGDRGYCYIPYQYMTNDDFCFDAWSVRTLATDSFGQEHWDNSDAVNFTDVTRHGHHHHHHHHHHRDSPNHNQSDDDNCVIEGVNEDDNYDDDDSDKTSNHSKTFGGGNNHSKDHHRHHERRDRNSGDENFHYDQSREKENLSRFRGVYPNIDELLKGSKFFNNQLPLARSPQPASYGRKGYGEGYGYSNS